MSVAVIDHATKTQHARLLYLAVAAHVNDSSFYERDITHETRALVDAMAQEWAERTDTDSLLEGYVDYHRYCLMGDRANDYELSDEAIRSLAERDLVYLLWKYTTPGAESACTTCLDTATGEPWQAAARIHDHLHCPHHQKKAAS